MNLINELTTTIEERGWSMRELGRRSGVSISLVSLVLSEQAPATADFCIKVARALGWNKEETLRKAGILDPLPPEVAQEEDALRLFRQLDPQLRSAMLHAMHSLQGIRTIPTILQETVDFPAVVWTVLEGMKKKEREDLARRFIARIAAEGMRTEDLTKEEPTAIQRG